MEWFKIFSSEEQARASLTGKATQLLIINDHRICLASYKNEFFAIEDTCSHNGESLSKGQINYLGEVICPWHNYRFELRTGRACDSNSRDLKTYPIKSDSTGFFIGI
jgi:nitrite reductase/ring-hydroxylating ferredoxin subunit